MGNVWKKVIPEGKTIKPSCFQYGKVSTLNKTVWEQASKPNQEINVFVPRSRTKNDKYFMQMSSNHRHIKLRALRNKRLVAETVDHNTSTYTLHLVNNSKIHYIHVQKWEEKMKVNTLYDNVMLLVTIKGVATMDQDEGATKAVMAEEQLSAGFADMQITDHELSPMFSNDFLEKLGDVFTDVAHKVETEFIAEGVVVLPKAEGEKDGDNS
jgi:hypothetical protein